MLLLDEPFGALDAKVRKELRQGLRDIHDETGLTTVFVTHDQDEAMELADLVVVMSMGRIEQVAEDRHTDNAANGSVAGAIPNGGVPGALSNTPPPACGVSTTCSSCSS